MAGDAPDPPPFQSGGCGAPPSPPPPGDGEDGGAPGPPADYPISADPDADPEAEGGAGDLFAALPPPGPPPPGGAAPPAGAAPPGEVGELGMEAIGQLTAQLGSVTAGLSQQLLSITEEMNRIKAELYGDQGLGGLAQELQAIRSTVAEQQQQEEGGVAGAQEEGMAGGAARAAPGAGAADAVDAAEKQRQRQRRREELRAAATLRRRARSPERRRGPTLKSQLWTMLVTFALAYILLAPFRQAVHNVWGVVSGGGGSAETGHAWAP